MHSLAYINKVHVTLLILCYLHVLSLPSSLSTNSRVKLDIEPRSICLGRNHTLPIYCTLINVNTSDHWIIVWYHNDQILPADRITIQSINHLRSQVMVGNEGKITCLAKYDTITVQQNSTFVYMKPSIDIKNDSVIYTTIDSHNVIKVSWLGDNHSSYVFAFRWQQDYDDISPTQWTFIDMKSSALTCKKQANNKQCTVMFNEDENIFTNVSFYVISSNEACENIVSRTWTVYLVPFHYEHNTSYNTNMVVFTPPKIARLILNTAYRSVTLNWSHDNEQVGYYYTYKCQGGVLESTNVTKNSHNQLRLTDKDIKDYRPFNLCVFCIHVLWYYDGNPSPPCCNHSRLSEEVPTFAPYITCNKDSCPIMHLTNNLCNLTLSWQLPRNTTWNGVITNLLIYTISNNQRRNITIPSHGDVTNGSYSILLNTTGDYVIFMKACNKAGCGSQGNTIEIPSLVTNQQTTSNNSPSLYYILFVLIPFVTVGTIIFVWYRRRRMTNTDAGNRLPELTEPEDPYYDFPNNNHIDTYDKIQR